MSANGNYIWRCAKCFNHLATITKMDGVIQIEKKCSKCKSVNVVTYVNDEVRVVCKNALKNISIDY